MGCTGHGLLICLCFILFYNMKEEEIRNLSVNAVSFIYVGYV